MNRLVVGMALAVLVALAPRLDAAEPLPEPVPFDSTTTARHRDVAARLAAAVATDDATAFRALHSKSGWAQTDDWWQARLAGQKKTFGPITRATGLYRGVIRFGQQGIGVPAEGAAVLLYFTRPAAAAMNFTLDGDGKIATSSLWVDRTLAQADTAGVSVLWSAPPTAGARP